MLIIYYKYKLYYIQTQQKWPNMDMTNQDFPTLMGKHSIASSVVVLLVNPNNAMVVVISIVPLA